MIVHVFGEQWGIVELRSVPKPVPGLVSFAHFAELGDKALLRVQVPNVDPNAAQMGEALAERTYGQGFTEILFPLGDLQCIKLVAEDVAREEAVTIAFERELEWRAKLAELDDKALPSELARLVDEARAFPAFRDQFVKTAASVAATRSTDPAPPQPEPKATFGGVVNDTATMQLTPELIGERHGSDVCPCSGAHKWTVVHAGPKEGTEPDHEAERRGLGIWAECRYCDTWAELSESAKETLLERGLGSYLAYKEIATP